MSEENQTLHGTPPEEMGEKDIKMTTTTENTTSDTKENDMATKGEASDGQQPSTEKVQRQRSDGRVELTDEMAYDKTGYAFPVWKKWMILSVIFVVQVSMNYNTSVYPNTVDLIVEDPRYRGVSEQEARVGQLVFLVAFSFACEGWATWSEELGRWPILQLSLFLVNCT